MPATVSGSKKAPQVGAFFVLLGLCLPGAGAAACAPDSDPEPVKVRHVHDGDTLILADDTRVRLIGINTPELARDGKPAEALAYQARDTLRRLLFQNGNRARLQPGIEARDKHGRRLAHLWLADGTNLAEQLLGQGLGWYVADAPNVQRIDCYRAAEARARSAGRGLWRKPARALQASRDLGLRERGFRLVRGRITRVNHGGGATWVQLEGRFAVRIPDTARRWFERLPDASWIGDTAEARGWLYASRAELRMTVDHPAALHRLPAPVTR